MRHLTSAGLLSLLAIGCPSPATESIAKAATADEENQLVTASQDLIRGYEEQLKNAETLRDRRAVSGDEVDHYKLQVARAKRFLAAQQSKPAVACEQSREIVVIRERQLDRELRLTELNASTPTELDAAKRNVAVARYWLAVDEGKSDAAIRHLRAVTEICEREHKRERARQRQGVVSENTVKMVEYHLAMARFYSAKLQEDKAEAVRQLKSVMGICDTWLEQERTLARHNIGSSESKDNVTVTLLWTERRLAAEEGKQDGVKENLRGLVTILERQLKSDAWLNPHDKAALQWWLAFERYRLAQAAAGINVEFCLEWELETPKSEDSIENQIVECGPQRNTFLYRLRHR
jgi:hypothetical protein